MPSYDLEEISYLISKAKYLAERRQLATVVHLLRLAMTETADAADTPRAPGKAAPKVSRAFPRRRSVVA
jgi:hypothetical protein